MPGAYLLCGDARALPLADGSVQCVVTSPPYWGLRSYLTDPRVWGGDAAHPHQWGESERSSQRNRNGQGGSLEGGTPPGMLHPATGAFCPCGSWRGELGLEPTPDLYVAHLVEVFREVRRVCRADATVWLNLGDSYSAGNSVPPGKTSTLGLGRGDGTMRSVRLRQESKHEMPTQRRPSAGLKPKDLVGIPWRVAFALQADGWWLRSDIIWAKPNPMPESITDRPTKAHEYLFLLTKRATYFYDSEAIKESITEATARDRVDTGRFTPDRGYPGSADHGSGRLGSASSRNRRSVWEIATQPYPEAHFATFPDKLVEPCILAGTSERGACPTCGAPWEREVERPSLPRVRDDCLPSDRDGGMTNEHGFERTGMSHNAVGKWLKANPPLTTGWAPGCQCPPAATVPCRVLDPFAGSGTTVAVAERLGRVGVGVELSKPYLALARRRTVQAGLL